jgi:hypothetical protein
MHMWKRQEIQKVLRGVGLAIFLAGSLRAALLPEQFGTYQKIARGVVTITDRPVWDEYGFKTAERADYDSSGKRISVSVWLLQDTTGAFAAAQWLQSGVVQHGNYVLDISGEVRADDLKDLKAKLPDVDRAANPTLPRFLPSQGRIPNSERYILGPASLAKFEPAIPSGLAGFEKGAEAHFARYKVEGGEARFLLLSYPTPQIAGIKLREFINGLNLKARRHGPFVAIALGATPAAADQLLGAVGYQPNVTWSEAVPRNENPGDMILAISILAMALMGLSVVLGLFFSGFRLIRGSKFGVHAIDQNFTSLHLDR